jgi:hypothetical protein
MAKLQTKNQTKGMTPMNTQMKTLMSQHIFNSNTCRILFATCLSALCLIALSAEAATIIVMNAADSGTGSLREALADANDGDTINFDASLNYIGLLSGELVVDKSVTISGSGEANLMVVGNQRVRVFHITNGVTVSISGLSIRLGWSDDGGGGGGILNDHSTLTVSNCMIWGNLAGIYDLGGGICNDGSFGSASLEINNSSVLFNDSEDRGGGIYNNGVSGSATLTINNSTVRGNSAGNAGGGIYNDGSEGSATLTINNSTLSDNSAWYAGSSGGGIYNTPDSYGNGTVMINNSTVSGNSAGFDGGGIHNAAIQSSATLTLNNSTVSDNSAVYGGGISNGTAIGSATLTIGNTILKTGGSGENIFNVGGTVTSDGYNLSNDDGGGFLIAIGDQINTDPLLGPLQDNGGPTFTHALLTGSPAIDAGDPNFNPNSFNPPMVYDQRGTGFNRVVNGRVDIGAFEVQAVPSSYAGQVQQPINADGSSVFSVRRGVVPVKFTLTQGGIATCALPPATIAVTRTSGGATGAIDESVYSGSADTGSNFRIDNCQYVYNLSASALGVGTYRIDITINNQVVGSGVFQLK